MTSLENAINLGYLFLTFNPPPKKTINTFTTFFCTNWYVSIYSEEFFWPQYMYYKMSPNNGFSWCPLVKLSHLGLEQLYRPNATNNNVLEIYMIDFFCKHFVLGHYNPYQSLEYEADITPLWYFLTTDIISHWDSKFTLRIHEWVITIIVLAIK